MGVTAEFTIGLSSPTHHSLDVPSATAQVVMSPPMSDHQVHVELAATQAVSLVSASEEEATSTTTNMAASEEEPPSTKTTPPTQAAEGVLPTVCNTTRGFPTNMGGTTASMTTMKGDISAATPFTTGRGSIVVHAFRPHTTRGVGNIIVPPSHATSSVPMDVTSHIRMHDDDVDSGGVTQLESTTYQVSPTTARIAMSSPMPAQQVNVTSSAVHDVPPLLSASDEGATSATIHVASFTTTVQVATQQPMLASEEKAISATGQAALLATVILQSLYHLLHGPGSSDIIITHESGPRHDIHSFGGQYRSQQYDCTIYWKDHASTLLRYMYAGQCGGQYGCSQYGGASIFSPFFYRDIPSSVAQVPSSHPVRHTKHASVDQCSGFIPSSRTDLLDAMADDSAHSIGGIDSLHAPFVSKLDQMPISLAERVSCARIVAVGRDVSGGAHSLYLRAGVGIHAPSCWHPVTDSRYAWSACHSIYPMESSILHV